MEQSEPQPGTEGRDSGEPRANERPPRLLRVRLWQAIGGMSVAIAIAALIVLLEIAASKARLNNYVNRRVAALNATVRTLRHQKAVEQRTLGSVRERATEGEVFEKILFASDLRTIKLTAPAEKDRVKDKSSGQSGALDLPTGKLAMSESADVAMLQVNGLRPGHVPGLPYLVDAETWIADLGRGFSGWRRRARDSADRFACWTRERNDARGHAGR